MIKYKWVKQWFQWMGSYLENVGELCWQGLQGLTALIVFPILIPLNLFYGIYRKIICDVLGKHHWMGREYCDYCERWKSHEVINDA